MGLRQLSGEVELPLEDPVVADRTRAHPIARRIWERLVDEHDAQVAESTIRQYVRAARP